MRYAFVESRCVFQLERVTTFLSRSSSIFANRPSSINRFATINVPLITSPGRRRQCRKVTHTSIIGSRWHWIIDCRSSSSRRFRINPRRRRRRLRRLDRHRHRDVDIGGFRRPPSTQRPVGRQRLSAVRWPFGPIGDTKYGATWCTCSYTPGQYMWIIPGR